MSSLPEGVKHGVISTGIGMAAGLAAYFGFQASPGNAVAAAAGISMVFTMARSAMKIERYNAAVEKADYHDDGTPASAEYRVPFLDVPAYKAHVAATQIPAAWGVFAWMCN